MVLALMSVKRKVTAPLGRSGMIRSRRSAGRGSTRLSHVGTGIRQIECRWTGWVLPGAGGPSPR